MYLYVKCSCSVEFIASRLRIHQWIKTICYLWPGGAIQRASGSAVLYWRGKSETAQAFCFFFLFFLYLSELKLSYELQPLAAWKYGCDWTEAVWLPCQFKKSNREFGGREAETERRYSTDSKGFVILSLNLAVNPASDSQAPDSLIIPLSFSMRKVLQQPFWGEARWRMWLIDKCGTQNHGLQTKRYVGGWGLGGDGDVQHRLVEGKEVSQCWETAFGWSRGILHQLSSWYVIFLALFRS